MKLFNKKCLIVQEHEVGMTLKNRFEKITIVIQFNTDSG